mgnify:CR=1 FL=1
MDFNKIKEMGLEYAEKGKNAALDLAEKGRTQAKIVNAQGKLYRAQSQQWWKEKVRQTLQINPRTFEKADRGIWCLVKHA